MYASDVGDPAVRVRELKALIEAIHQSGMGVILDVVYNHTANTAVLDNLAPGYYYRTGRNKSGCGNDTASERAMMRRLIVDSITYWVQEYKIDGFRFDLMGLHDQATVLAAHAAAKKLNPPTLFIGEGWKMNTDLAIEGGWADQSGMLKTDAFGVFSDGFRDILKGGGFNEGAPGFLTGLARNPEEMLAFIVGKKLTGSDAADHPGDAVQYIAAHDGLTWHDTVAVALKTTNSTEIYRRLKLGNLFVLTAQGVAFLHAGQEFGRTKYYEGRELSEIIVDSQNKVKYLKNSYDASDRVNMIDWTRVASPAGRELYAYTKGLIALRRASDAFRLGPAAFERVKRIPADGEKPEELAFGMRSVDGKGAAYYVFVNADGEPRSFTDPGLSGAVCLVDEKQAGTAALVSPKGVTVAGNTVTLAPLTGAVFRK
jgi:pullulanase/glycogen debranching enzyme